MGEADTENDYNEWAKLLEDRKPPPRPWWQRAMLSLGIGSSIPRPHYDALRKRMISKGIWKKEYDGRF